MQDEARSQPLAVFYLLALDVEAQLILAILLDLDHPLEPCGAFQTHGAVVRELFDCILEDACLVVIPCIPARQTFLEREILRVHKEAEKNQSDNQLFHKQKEMLIVFLSAKVNHQSLSLTIGRKLQNTNAYTSFCHVKNYKKKPLTISSVRLR